MRRKSIGCSIKFQQRAAESIAATASAGPDSGSRICKYVRQSGAPSTAATSSTLSGTDLKNCRKRNTGSGEKTSGSTMAQGVSCKRSASIVSVSGTQSTWNGSSSART